MAESWWMVKNPRGLLVGKPRRRRDELSFPFWWYFTESGEQHRQRGRKLGWSIVEVEVRMLINEKIKEEKNAKKISG